MCVTEINSVLTSNIPKSTHNLNYKQSEYLILCLMSIVHLQGPGDSYPQESAGIKLTNGHTSSRVPL